MATKAGIWIDHKQAIVVLITDAGQEITKVKSSIEQAVRPAGSSLPKNKYTPNDFVAEDRLERKFDSHLKNFYDEVAACLQGSDALLILGPGEAPGEFSKHLKAKKLRGLVVESETADKMTDRQLAAKVQQHFTTSSAKKSVAPKKTGKKKTATTSSKKPTKKSGK